ncbi:MAG: hypothetical protein ABEK16_06640 [Candidatus Nanohalobium sp.]
MERQLYDSLVAEYSVGISNQEDFIPSEDVEGIVEMLDGKVNSELSVDDVEVNVNSDGSYDVEVKGYEEESLANEGVLNYSPEDQRCVTHSNKPVGGEPPEGPTTDGKGEMNYGMR